jgi:hypothetical protein
MVAALPFAGTYLYVSMWREDYFPGRYEDAYHALTMAA